MAKVKKNVQTTKVSGTRVPCADIFKQWNDLHGKKEVSLRTFSRAKTDAEKELRKSFEQLGDRWHIGHNVKRWLKRHAGKKVGMLQIVAGKRAGMWSMQEVKPATAKKARAKKAKAEPTAETE